VDRIFHIVQILWSSPKPHLCGQKKQLCHHYLIVN